MSDVSQENIQENLSLEQLHVLIEDLLDEQRFNEVREALAPFHPSEIADLISGFGGLQRNQIFDLLTSELRAEVLIELEEFDQEKLLDRMTDGQIGQVLDQLDSDDAADIAGTLDDERRLRVLEATDPEDRDEVERLLTYDEETAGGIMALEMVTVSADATAREGVEAVRTATEEGMEDIHYLYVVENGGKFVGRVKIIDLMLASRHTPITNILDEDTVAIEDHLDQEDVAHIFTRRDLISAPVVDDRGRLKGRITIDDIVDVISDEADEDFGKLAGAGEEEAGERNIFRVTRSRLPWLLIAFLGELLSVVVLSGYEERLQDLIVITFFIPVVIAVAGNVGVQSSTIVVRGLATGDIPAHNAFRKIMHELVVGLLNGTIISVLFMGIIYLWKGAMDVAFAVSLALIFVVIVAAITGSMIPFVLKKLKQDPAYASGPFITMTNDVIGLAIYMIITTSML